MPRSTLSALRLLLSTVITKTEDEKENSLSLSYALYVSGVGVQQAGFTKFFNLYSGFPAVVVLHPKKKAYVPYVGAYDVEHLSEFLDRVLGGQKRLMQLPSALPALVDESATGEKIPVPPVKEDL